ncbi:hypothetical protein ACFFMN_23180 [Planobispora siamensis]|uniref:Uncharacterized protein n=1 Tax=Planobispora siamensis TaxID=936338 RepID=A0A8J3SLC0_9ACTN|nr:hypothetical protein [Planobispora siamensis]GIH95265.1 hypothetical protein Psi01_58950 [Planobispora siamensis]
MHDDDAARRHSPLPGLRPGENITYPVREPTGQMPEDDAVEATRRYLAGKGKGFTFRPREVYDDLFRITGRTAAWVRSLALPALAGQGGLSYDQFNGTYTVTGTIDSLPRAVIVDLKDTGDGQTVAIVPPWALPEPADTDPEVSIGLTPLTTSDVNEVLRWATQITSDIGDPDAVITNAEPIIAWLKDGAERGDLPTRLMAAKRTYTNDSNSNREPDDDPTAFLMRAAAYYTVLHDTL